MLAGAALVWWAVPPAVQVAEVEERQVVATLIVAGAVEPATEVGLASEVAGRVVEVLVEVGDPVERGQPMVVLDDEDRRLELGLAEASVSEAKARLEGISDGGAQGAQAELDQALVEEAAAVEEYERARKLWRAGVGTRGEVDERQRRMEIAGAQARRARVANRESQPGGSEQAQAQAALERAEQQRRRAALMLEKTTLYAPGSGVVLNREVEVGTVVQPGEPVARVGWLDPVEVRVDPDEREIANLEVGQAAAVVADAFPDRPVAAQVVRVDPTVDPAAGTVAVWLRIDEGAQVDRWRSRMTVTAEIETARGDKEGVVVPRAAVRGLDEDAPFVLRLHQRRARRVELDVGISSDSYVEVLEGLHPGDLVIVDDQVEPGDRIRQGDRFDVPETQDQIEDSPRFGPPALARQGAL